MRGYAAVLRLRDYRLLWTGSTVSLLGDGATWTALTWLVLERAGTAGLGILTVSYTLPVILGGMMVGPLLDRFSRRAVLVADCLFRAGVVASVPVASALGWGADVRTGQLYVVAGVFGLLKIVPLGAVPAIMPDLVPADRLQAAAALETVAFGAANMLGPAVGGLLIGWVGGQNVLTLDAVTYVVFALAVLAIRSPLPRPARPDGTSPGGDGDRGGGWGPVLSLLRADRILLAITVGFGMFNVGMGMLRLGIPWLAHERLPGGAGGLGLLLGVASAANLVGSLIAGMLPPSDRQMRRIGALQALAGISVLLLLVTSFPWVLTGLCLVNALSSPMAVSSQVVRLARIPAALRGRTMTLMRTVLNGAIPAGAGLAALLLGAGRWGAMVGLMATVAAVPGVVVFWCYRRSSSTVEPAAPVATRQGGGR